MNDRSAYKRCFVRLWVNVAAARAGLRGYMLFMDWIWQGLRTGRQKALQNWGKQLQIPLYSVFLLGGCTAGNMVATRQGTELAIKSLSSAGIGFG